MLGHPGFSAMEYAGRTGGEEKSSVRSEGGFRRRFGRRAASPTPLEHAEERPHAADIEDTDPDLPPQSAEEATCYQRRRGTFMNHTPRDFEIPSPRRTETPHAYYDDFRHTNDSFHDCPMNSIESGPLEQQRGDRKHMSNSSGGTGRLSKSAHSATTSRKASRATSSIGSGRYSPLEPLVAQHRREVTGSDVDTLPPYVDIENVSQKSALFAVQEYFKSLEIGGSAKLVGEASLSVQTRASPNLPSRKPERMNSPTSPRHAYAGSSQSDFTSAACGQYSPYGGPHTSSQTPRRNHGAHELNGGRSTPDPEHVLTAPPIPSHEELTSQRPLNDLNYFLRNTGPAEKTTSEKKERKGFGFGKARNKKTLAAKFGSVEGSPAKDVQPPVPFHPTCAQEMKTSRGAKHLQIVIPTAASSTSNRPRTPPVFNSNGISKRVSVLMTEELLNPLASSDVENAILGSNRNGSKHGTPKSSPVSSRTVIRSPKRPAISPKAVPVVDHPLLMTREEQTRQRKLRDLQQSKRKLVARSTEDAVSGAPPTPVESLRQVCASIIESASIVESVRRGDNGRREDPKEEILRLERLADELARELASAVGIDLSDGAREPEDVLEMARAHGAKGRR